MVLLFHILNPNIHKLYTQDKNQGYILLFDLVLGGSWLLWKTFASNSKNKIGIVLVLDQKKIQKLIIQKKWISVLVQILILNINGTRTLVSKPILIIKPKSTIQTSQTWYPPNVSCFT